MPQGNTVFTETTVFKWIENNSFWLCLANDKPTSRSYFGIILILESLINIPYQCVHSVSERFDKILTHCSPDLNCTSAIPKAKVDYIEDQYHLIE